MPLKQALACLCLQIADPATDRAMRQPNFLPGSRVALQPSGRFECAQRL